MMQVLNHGNKANIGFGSTLTVDNTGLKRQIGGEFSGEIPVRGSLDIYTKLPAKAAEAKKINPFFSEATIAKMTKRLQRFFAKKTEFSSIEIALNGIENPGTSNNEFITGSMTIGDKTRKFIGMAPLKDAEGKILRPSSLIRNILSVYKDFKLPH